MRSAGGVSVVLLLVASTAFAGCLDKAERLAENLVEGDGLRIVVRPDTERLLPTFLDTYARETVFVFEARLFGKLVDARWDLGDGTTSRATSTVTHTYDAVRTYVVEAVSGNQVDRVMVRIGDRVEADGRMPVNPMGGPLPIAPETVAVPVSPSVSLVMGIVDVESAGVASLRLVDAQGGTVAETRMLGAAMLLAEVEAHADETWHFEMWQDAGVPDQPFTFEANVFPE